MSSLIAVNYMGRYSLTESTAYKVETTVHGKLIKAEFCFEKGLEGEVFIKEGGYEIRLEEYISPVRTNDDGDFNDVCVLSFGTKGFLRWQQKFIN